MASQHRGTHCSWGYRGFRLLWWLPRPPAIIRTSDTQLAKHEFRRNSPSHRRGAFSRLHKNKQARQDAGKTMSTRGSDWQNPGRVKSPVPNVGFLPNLRHSSSAVTSLLRSTSTAPRHTNHRLRSSVPYPNCSTILRYLTQNTVPSWDTSPKIQYHFEILHPKCILRYLIQNTVPFWDTTQNTAVPFWDTTQTAVPFWDTSPRIQYHLETPHPKYSTILRYLTQNALPFWDTSPKIQYHFEIPHPKYSTILRYLTQNTIPGTIFEIKRKCKPLNKECNAVVVYFPCKTERHLGTSFRQLIIPDTSTLTVERLLEC